MSATLLANELTTLISEAKRKNPELKGAAERSLQELKSLPTTSEQQLAAGSGVSSLQRLIVSKGLPKNRLNEALGALNACTELGLDVQLKILQALPSLLQNYSEDLKGDLLAGALQVCSSLQSAKVQTVSGVASATLQQLVTAVFENVIEEDRNGGSTPATEEVPGDDGPILLRPAAFDAYRVFRDLVLTAEERPSKFVHFNSLSPESSLELIWSSMTANAKLFDSHIEFSSVIRANLIPLATGVLLDRLSFPITVRSLRLLEFLFGRYLSRFPGELEIALSLIPQNLDDSTPSWKRALIMEAVRNIFAKSNLVVEAYSIYDMSDSSKLVVQDLLSAFVRLSSEKPALIGLGHQSSVPTGPTIAENEPTTDQATLEAMGGMAGVISSALGVAENNVYGISRQWSIPRTACLDQLDKGEAPPVPDTYVYALVLECLASLSETLARIVLPLTVQSDGSHSRHSVSETNTDTGGENNGSASRLSRSQSLRKLAVSLNPLESEIGSGQSRVQAVASLVDRCWPAVLATSSTFLNAALEDQYYRNLIKSYQRFAQVAGLLRLNTPRDALMTTLSKSAIPPHVFNAAVVDPMKSPATESSSPRIFSNPKNFLSVDSLVSQASSMAMDRDRRPSGDPVRPMLTIRNLLCLRALLNLAIALGPTLYQGLAVVVDALRQADIILSAAPPQQMLRQANTVSAKVADSPAAVAAFSSEVSAVEAAASRLLESTVDYPNDAFTNVIQTFGYLLSGRSGYKDGGSPKPDHESPPSTPKPTQRRTLSGLPGLSTSAELKTRDYQFVIPKIGHLVSLNTSRFTTDDPHESGWNLVVTQLTRIVASSAHPRDARQAATSVICRMAAEVVGDVVEDEPEDRAVVQRRTLAMLWRLIDSMQVIGEEMSSTDLEIQAHVLDSMRSLLEHCGDSIVAGWDKIVAVISRTFERVESNSTQPIEEDEVETSIDWINVSHDFVSVQVGRIAFTAIQLICSDFLASLPLPIVVSLIELLGRFITQTEDLNLALTTVTTAWNLSDFMFSNVTTSQLDNFARSTQEFESVEEAVHKAALHSHPAQTLLLLLRLRDASNYCRKDVRNAVFQTICSIFRSHGSQLDPATWDVMLRSVLLRVATDDALLYLNDDQAPSLDDTHLSQHSPRQDNTDETMSTAMIAGIADVISQHLRIIERVAKLPSLWEVFLCMMENYLDAEKHAINAAVYSSLSTVLSHIDSETAVWTAPSYRTVALWLKRVPQTADHVPQVSNQDAFNAYVSTATELYRLTRISMGTPQLRKLIDNLFLCVKHSDAPKHGGDVNIMSTLQTKVLELLKCLRVDLDMIPSRLITVAAQLCLLHHEASDVRQGPTFLALSCECVEWLQVLMTQHMGNPEIWESGALLSAVQSLRKLVVKKYHFRTEHKGQALWRRSTNAALVLSRHVLGPVKKGIYQDPESRTMLWDEYVAICAGIVGANGIESVDDRQKIYDDQLFDIEMFRSLQAVIVPRLGEPGFPHELRERYCRALYEASLVHALETSEVLEPGKAVLEHVDQLRRGRVKHAKPNERERMCYLCFAELVTLSSSNTSTDQSDARTEMYSNLAQTAAPFLIFRLAVPIRSYIVDQPLRGRRPQPLSEVEELLFSLKQIRELDLRSKALSTQPGQADRRAHFRFLYPLLIKAAAIAGDRRVGSEKIQHAVIQVLESVVVSPD
nr:protein mon2 like [Quercus suber]